MPVCATFFFAFLAVRDIVSIQTSSKNPTYHREE